MRNLSQAARICQMPSIMGIRLRHFVTFLGFPNSLVNGAYNLSKSTLPKVLNKSHFHFLIDETLSPLVQLVFLRSKVLRCKLQLIELFKEYICTGIQNAAPLIMINEFS